MFVSLGKRVDKDFSIEDDGGFEDVDILDLGFGGDNWGSWFCVFVIEVKFCFWVLGICVWSYVCWSCVVSGDIFFVFIGEFFDFLCLFLVIVVIIMWKGLEYIWFLVFFCVYK